MPSGVSDARFLIPASKYLISKYVTESEDLYQKPFSDRERKISAIISMVERDILDYPTQGLIYSWMKEDVNFLEHISSNGFDMSKRNAIELELGTSGYCHAIASFYYVANDPSIRARRLCTGFASKTWRHSWLIDVDTGNILEPTPTFHEHYFGAYVADPMMFVAEQLPFIESLCNEFRFAPEDIAAFNAGAKRKGYPFFLRG